MNNMVSGSIVTFNNISTIEKTLETIFTQTKDIDFKLYIVDNGSNDGTPEFDPSGVADPVGRPDGQYRLGTSGDTI